MSPAPTTLNPAAKSRLVLKIAAIATAVLVVLSFIQFWVSVRALRDHFSSGPQWAFPSRVYSDALTFTPGRAMPLEYLKSHLALRSYRAAPLPITKPGTYALTPAGLEVFTRGIRDADDPLGIRGPEHFYVAIADSHVVRVARLGGLAGIPIADTLKPARLEPVQVAQFSDDHDVRRNWVPLVSIPKALRDAVVASEDRRFYQHRGIDLRSNLRALVINSKSGGVRQGASTITQQLARGLFLTSERNVFRKVREVFLALGLEMLLSKDEILEMYLNSIYLGQETSGGVAGVGEGARRYFDTPVEALDLSQAAVLVGLIPAPNLYSPFRNPKAALERRNLVLGAMAETGKIDAEQAAVERARPVVVTAGKPKGGRFPSFTGYVHEYLRSRLPEGAAEHAGLNIYTTLDPIWQAQAEAVLPGALAGIGREPKGDSLEGAFVALDKTGAVLAMVGGRHDIPGGFNRAFQALRQPGSAMKPIVYAAALDSERVGRRFNPASTIPDMSRDFATAQGPWHPKNDDGEYHPQVTLAKALAKSLNVATANLVEAIEPRVVTRYADRFGLHGLKPLPSVGLGTSEVTLVGITDAYTTFPNGGMRSDACPLRAVMNVNGRPYYKLQNAPVRVIPTETAALMTGLLEDVVTFGISNPLRKKHGFTRPVAGKTGTTNDYYDAWFVGFTPDVVAGVWVGYDTPKTLGAPAAEMALPVWASVMTRLLTGFPATEFESDQHVELAWVDPFGGALHTANCPYNMRVPFLPGMAPRDTCALDHTADWAAKFEKRSADSLATIARATKGSKAADSTGSAGIP